MTPISVCSIPSGSGSNPYITSINGHLEELGVSVVAPERNMQAIREILQPGLILHFHWPSRLYTGSTSSSIEAAKRDWLEFLDDTRAAGARIVWTAHNLWPHERSFPSLDTEARRLLVRSADWVIVHCHCAARAISATFGTPRAIAVIPHPCYNVFPSPARQPLERSSGPSAGLVLLAFGVMRAYKGLDFLVNTFVRHASPNDRLVVAGASHRSYDPTSLRNLCASDNRITLLERDVPTPELDALFLRSDVVVFGYTEILSSGAVALAQSFGKPVIAPRLGCMSEAVPWTTGELYEPSCPASLSEAIERIRHRDLATLGAAGQALIRRQTPASFARRLLTIYQELACAQAPFDS